MNALDSLLATQSESGAFASVVRRRDESFIDANAFVTALAIDALCTATAAGPTTGTSGRAVERALDFLMTCRNPGGGFSFYPPNGEPAWLGARLAPDADDTALCTATLVRHGRLPESEVVHVLEHVLAPHRVQPGEASRFAWVRPGASRTWLDERAWPNPVDLCVNANVAALFRISPQRGAAYEASWRTVALGAEWAARDATFLPYLTPFYPSRSELAYALQRAVACGVDELTPAMRQLGPADADERTPLCSSNGGGTVWLAPALQRLRLAQQERKANEL